MNGFELCSRILEIDINVRICFITAGDTNIEALREVYPTSSIGCFIKKPVSINELIRRLKMELDQLEQLQEYKEILPLTEDIAALQIHLGELIALKDGINQTIKHYNLPPLIATLELIDDIKYNKMRWT